MGETHIRLRMTALRIVSGWNKGELGTLNPLENSGYRKGWMRRRHCSDAAASSIESGPLGLPGACSFHPKIAVPHMIVKVFMKFIAASPKGFAPWR
jgi:hypothetical protein